MNIEPREIMGSDSDLTAVHAVSLGAHDALSDLTKYAIMGIIVAGVGVVILPPKIRRKLKDRFL